MRRTPFHVQITLVGGSPTPVYQGIVHMQPNQVVLVCSEQTKDTAENIRKELPSYSEGNILIYQMPDNNVCQMYETFEMIEHALPKGITISLNLTGGMKLWSVIANNVFRRKRRSCRTFFIGQNGTFFDLKDKVSKGSVAFDMDAQFRILGHEFDEFTPLTEYVTEDYMVLNHIMQIFSNERQRYFLTKTASLFYDEYKSKYGNTLFRHNFEVDDKYQNLKWDAEKLTFEYRTKTRTYTFSSPHVACILLNTGWFELYVAKLISEKYGKDNVRLNCIFRNKTKLPKNEIDIIVNTGSKLVFVECKTQVFNATDVDKFRAAVRNYGGLGSKPLFVTYWKMKPEAEEKCNDHHITTFYLDNPTQTNSSKRAEALGAVFDDLNKTWNY